MAVTGSFLKCLRFFEKNGFLWLCYLFICSLFLSRAGLAITGVILTVFAVVHYLRNPFKVSLTAPQVFFFAIYIILLVYVAFSRQNSDYGLQLLFKNSVFWILPLVFLLSKKLSERNKRKVVVLFVFLAILCVTVNTVVALLNYKQFLENVSNSKNLDSLIGPSYSELGLLTVVGFIFGFYLLKISKILRYKLFLFGALSLLFIELHIVAYRFSLISIYLIIVIYAIVELIRKRNFKLFFFTVVVLSSTLYTMSLVPSVKLRFVNTANDLSAIIQHKNPNYQSVTQRILAIDCALEVVAQHPWLGVSPVNARQKMEEQYDKNSYLLIPENRVFIHTQFGYYVLAFGIPLGLLFTISLFFLMLRAFCNNPLLFWILLCFVLHMMIENTLEKQISTNAFIFLFLLFDKKDKTLT